MRTHPEVVDKCLQKEMQLFSSFSEHNMPVVHIDLLRLYSYKSTSQAISVITGLSFPKGASVNATIDTRLCSLK